MNTYRRIVIAIIGAVSLVNSCYAQVTYSSISLQGFINTGIRSDSSNSVVVTASYNIGSGNTVATLYDGSLQAMLTAPSSNFNFLTPVFSGETVTSSTFYGPNTALFNPSLGTGNVRAVGSYKYTQGASGAGYDHGMMYVGPVTGGGTWTQLDATSLVSSGSLLDTLCHSTMGNLVVGNYDTSLATGQAFIYDVVANTWTNLNPMNSASVTAYGIWQNGGSTSTSYTIAGGFSAVNSGGVDEGYLVDYDSVTHALTNFKAFNFDNMPISALVSHFDGITATPTGFNLTGIYTAGSSSGAFFTSIPVLSDGSFGPANWTTIAFTNATGTTGNTVLGYNVLGIYIANSATSSYLAVVPDLLGGKPTTTANLNYSSWFGYYTANSFPLVYEYNLGYEYAYDSGNGGVYLYDFTSGHFFYTQASYYPFVYDFTLNTYLYYDMNSTTGGPRYFYSFGSHPGWFSQ